MSSLQLDSSSQIIPEPQKLPQSLVEKCAAISVRPNAIKDLVDAMQCKHTFLTHLTSGLARILQQENTNIAVLKIVMPEFFFV